MRGTPGTGQRLCDANHHSSVCDSLSVFGPAGPLCALSRRMSGQTGSFLFLGVFRSLGTVFGTCLTSLRHTSGIQSSADDMISGTRKVFYPASADQHNAVLLKVVAFTRNIAGNLDTIGKTYSGDLTKGGVRLLRSRGLHCGAYAALLRCGCVDRSLSQGIESFLESRSSGLLHRCLSSFSY